MMALNIKVTLFQSIDYYKIYVYNEGKERMILWRLDLSKKISLLEFKN